MVNSETWFTSVTESRRPTRSAADLLNLRPQASRLGILTKSGGELEQDPCMSKASKKCHPVSVSKMATEFAVTQWRKTPNWKENEET